MSDKIIFGKKTFSNLLEEIYNNQQKKEKQISSLINELKPLINDLGDASLVVPLIKEYMEIGVKNDDHLLKMAAIIQRSILAETTGNGDSTTMTDEEKTQLLEAVKNMDSK